MEDVEPSRAASRAARQVLRAKRRRTRWRVALIAVTVAVAILVGAPALTAVKLDRNITRVDVTKDLGPRPSQPGSVKSGPINILLIGSDDRGRKGDSARSDTNIVMHISGDRQSVTMVSIPRDSMVPAPRECSPTQPREEWVVRQWNHNFAQGGPGCLIRTVEGNTGLFINHFAVVDFGGFRDMVDALGGVEVDLPAPVKDKFTRVDLPAGRQTLNGDQGLGYFRTRYGIGDGSDLGRIDRQQEFMRAIARKATDTALLRRPDRLVRFLDVATTSLTTDKEFGFRKMSDLATSLQSLEADDITFVTVPVEGYAPDPNRVQWGAGADRLWAALRDDRVPDMSSTVATPSASG